MPEGDLKPGAALEPAPEKAPMSFGDSSFDSIVKQAVTGLQADSAETRQTLKANAGRTSDILTRLEASDKDKPTLPEIAPPEKPAQAPTAMSAYEQFGSAASVLATLGALATRRPLVAALNASAGAMKAMQTRDSEAFKQNLETWKANSEYAGKYAQWQLDRYRSALENHKGTQENLFGQLRAIAAIDQDAVAQHAMQTGDLQVVEKFMTDRQHQIERYEDRRLALDRFSSDQNTPERLATMQFKKEHPNATAHDWADFNRALKSATFNDFNSPVEVEITEPDGKPRQVLAQQNKATGQWVSADEKRVPIASDSLKVLGRSVPVSGREAVFTQRVLTSGLEAAKDLENVVELPTTASTGLFGGRTQGPGILDAGREVLANKMTSQESQSYNVMATGFQRSLATIETSGLAPQGSLTHQMDNLLFKEGDTNLTKLQKLAQIRQIVEAGMQIVADNPRLSTEQKEQATKINEQLRKAVPFTQTDLMKLQIEQANNPNMTLRQYAESQQHAGEKTGLTEQAVPPAYKDKPDGFVVYDKTGHAFQKRGDKLVPM